MDIIAAIDHATGCQQCGKDLSGSVSDDFCSEECQRTWHAARAGMKPPPQSSWHEHATEVLAGVRPRFLMGTPTEHFTHYTWEEGTLRQNLPTTAAFVIPAGGQVFRSNGTEWEPFGTISADFTIEGQL